MSEEVNYLFDPETEEIIEFYSNTSVGRSDSNDFPIKDQSVSSKHARLIIKEDGVYVEDLDSFNSTYVNGVELLPETPTKIEAKDVVQFGDKAFYFNAEEPCQAYLDLPTMTGSFKVGSDKTGQAIVHNYDEPIIDLSKKKKGFSLKNLRMHKEAIEKLQKKLEDVSAQENDRETLVQNIKNKEKEMGEFASYLESKNYSEETEVNAIIFSIEEVSERLEKDKGKVEEKINILKNQIEELRGEIKSLDDEKNKNQAMIEELNKDIEIIKGRDLLAEEIQNMNETLEKLTTQNFEEIIANIKEEIKAKKKEYKAAQEKYADTRFGKKGMFGKKAS